jgi:hypothetical protein
MKIRSLVIAAMAASAVAGTLAAQQVVTQTIQEIRTGGNVVVDGVQGLPGGPSNTPMPMGTGVVSGQVTEADSTRPVAGAIVTLSIPGHNRCA